MSHFDWDQNEIEEKIKFEKGPQEVMRALAFGNEDDLREALAFQREAFRAQLGCYPEECTLVFCNGLCTSDENHMIQPHPDCPAHAGLPEETP